MKNILDTLNVTKRLDPRLLAELAKQKRPLTFGFTCTVIVAASTLLQVQILQWGVKSLMTISAGVKAGAAGNAMVAAGFSTLTFACSLVVVLYAGRYWFVRGQTYFLSEATNRLSMELRVRMLQKLLRLPIGYYNDRRGGAIQSVLTNDVGVYQNAISIIKDSVGAPIKIAAMLLFIIHLQWQLAAIAAIIVPFMVYFMQQNSRRMRVKQTIVQENLASVSAITVEVLQGTRVIKAFGAEEQIQENYGKEVHKTFLSQMDATRVMASLAPLQELIGAWAIATIMFLCGVLAKTSNLTADTAFAIALAMDGINQGFRALGGLTNMYGQVQAASNRIHSEILDIPEMHETSGGRVLDNPVGRIRFENVSFTYPDGTRALNGVNFEIDPGKSLALVGPSGAGKSTIADLVLRFYDPTSGRILFDEVDIKELDIAWLRAHIGVVPQQTFLFAGTIEDNVRIGDPTATPDDIYAALCQANAHQFSVELKNRSNSDLGERGVRLSGGQMQRVAIARALVRRPTLLLLDEATSALDAESERLVTEALDDVMKGRTTLFIAHRLTTAARADKILVLSKGEVVELGSHLDLLEANGPYAGLFRAFSGGILG